jgi:hypothetical protein
MSGKQLRNTKRRVGRPVADTVRVSVTLSTEDYLLIDSVAMKTGTRPATMIRQLVVECLPTYKAMLDALTEIELGKKDSGISIMEKHMDQARLYAEQEISETKKDILKDDKK